jgi:hypothetical protein
MIVWENLQARACFIFKSKALRVLFGGSKVDFRFGPRCMLDGEGWAQNYWTFGRFLLSFSYHTKKPNSHYIFG